MPKLDGVVMSDQESPGASRDAKDKTQVGNQDAILAAIDAALGVQAPAAAAFVEGLRAKDPAASPEEMLEKLEKRFLAMTISSGAAAGASAPGAGIGLALTAGESVVSLGAAVFHILATAEVHQLRVRDVERQRTLVLAILLGQSADKLVGAAAGRTGRHWARAVLNSVPLSTIRQINRILGANFTTRYGSKEGAVLLGRVVPFGAGAGAGAGSGIGHAIVKSVRAAFGPPELPHPAAAISWPLSPAAHRLVLVLSFCVAAAAGFWMLSTAAAWSQ